MIAEQSVPEAERESYSAVGTEGLKVAWSPPAWAQGGPGVPGAGDAGVQAEWGFTI